MRTRPNPSKLLFLALLISGCSGSNHRADSGPDAAADGGDTDSYTQQACGASDIVAFPDSALEIAVRKSVNRYVLGESSGSIYDGDLTGELIAQLDTLFYTSNEGIAFLGGIECLTGAVEIYLSDNSVQDVSLLAGLGGVAFLDVSNNVVGSVVPLAGLMSLETLDVSGNPIEDMSPLSSLTGLGGLYANDIGFSSLEWVSGLTSLTGLWASGNAVTDLSPLESLENLVTLELADNGIVDISPLGNVSIQYRLVLSGNAITDIGPLAAMSGLDEIELSNNGISDLSPLAEIGGPNVTILKLDGNQIEDVTPLSTMTGPVNMALWDNRIVDLSPFVGSEFSQMWSSYDFSKNRIEDLSPLVSFGDFTELDISDNLVEDLRPLSGKTALGLRAARNPIHDLTPLIAPLAAEATYADLTDNRVTSIAPLVASARVALPLVGLPDWEILLGNPLDDVALQRHVPELCAYEAIEVLFGDGEYCAWDTSPGVPVPGYDTDVTPFEGPEEDEEEGCAADPQWMADGALPGAAHNGGDFDIDGAVATEPTVLDTVTGLEWRPCSEGQSWSAGACAGTADVPAWADLAGACSGSYGGHSDWRLAGAPELVSLIDYSVAYPGPTIDAAAFPGTYPGDYWTSTDLPGTSARIAYTVNFYGGSVSLAPTWTDGARVRCVRGGGTGIWEERFDPTAGDGGTVRDAWTGLEWRRCAEGQSWDGSECEGAGSAVEHASVASACEGSYSGYTDWRAPTLPELYSIANACGGNPASHSEAFPNTPTAPFWTSTSAMGTGDSYWTVDFAFGQIGGLGSGSPAWVRCVREY